MLTRRHLRVKVMQVLYIREQNADNLQLVPEKKLEELINKSYELYLYMLLLLTEIAEYATIHAVKQSEKLLEENKKIIISQKIANNFIIKHLRNNDQLQKAIKKHKLHHFIDKIVVQKLYQSLIATEEYQAYTSTDGSDAKADTKILSFLMTDIFASSTMLDEFMEDYFPNWEDDMDMVINYLVKNFAAKNLHKHIDASFDWKEEINFTKMLLKRSISGEDEYKRLIQEKTKNWEVDRITRIDIILMKMALCELIVFPTIPVKVSINEYIEISKYYSTPKSKEFINGILDKLKDELIDNGRISKSGRGLVQ